MNDALSAIGHPKVGYAKRLHILLQDGALRARVWLGHEVFNRREVLARRRPAALARKNRSWKSGGRETYGIL